MARKKKLDEPSGLQEQCRFDEADDAPDWVSTCFRARLRHRVPWVKLAAGVNRDWRTVRDNVTKYQKILSDAYAAGDDGALADYIEGLEDDKSRADSILNSSDEPKDAIAALKHITECRKLIASAKGVVTERKATELTGSGGAPLFAGMGDDELERLLASTAVGDPGGTGAPADSQIGGVGSD